MSSLPMSRSREGADNETAMGNDQIDVQQYGEDQDRGIVVNANDMPADVPVAKPKKNRKKKPASKRGIGKPTGFEEFHADAPLTPDQHEESRQAFDPALSFVDRILRAIQRFERTKRMSNERREVFYKYLAYGGVDVGPNMFVGALDTENMDKDQINTAMAQANISDEKKQTILDPKKAEQDLLTSTSDKGIKMRSSEHLAKYVVDFEGTMRGFLSRFAPTCFAFDTADDVKQVTTTLERFMDYLLLHEVCPEYKVEVLKTRNLCRTAAEQLWHCAEAQRHLPGDFNMACSTLFGGSFGENYDGETYWGPAETEGNVFVGLKPEQATQIVGFAIAGAASEGVYTQYLDIAAGESAGKGFDVVNTVQDHGFEITKIEPPSQECLDLYKENTSEFQPVGRVFAKFFRNPDAAPEDLTIAEQLILESNEHQNAGQDHQDDLYSQQYVFFVEQTPLLSLLHTGMRIEATIYELNCGVFFFDEVLRVLPSFDLWIENELMLDWKEPKPVAGAPALRWNNDGSKEADMVDVNETDHTGAPREEASQANGVAKEVNGRSNTHAHENPVIHDSVQTALGAAEDQVTNDTEDPY